MAAMVARTEVPNLCTPSSFGWIGRLDGRVNPPLAFSRSYCSIVSSCNLII